MQGDYFSALTWAFEQWDLPLAPFSGGRGLGKDSVIPVDQDTTGEITSRNTDASSRHTVVTPGSVPSIFFLLDVVRSRRLVICVLHG